MKRLIVTLLLLFVVLWACNEKSRVIDGGLPVGYANLPDGRTIVCIMNYSLNAISCDWGHSTQATPVVDERGVER